MKILIKDTINVEIYSACIYDKKSIQSIFASGKSTRDILRGITRVQSSNIWGYNINIRDRHDSTGDVVVQFKDPNGGPGDVYIYYDVPIIVYRRWHTASSAGHYFWRYIRNNYKYSKLTGNKRGLLPNAIN